MIFNILTVFGLVFIRFSDGRAFGQRVEYRYEYDPNRDLRPRVHVKFDDVTDETELMRIFNHRKPIEVRKKPSRYEYATEKPRFFEEENTYMFPTYKLLNEQNRGWHNMAMSEPPQWHTGFRNLPIQEYAHHDRSTENMAEHMAQFLRKQSEHILRQHFEDSAFSNHPYLPKFHFKK